MRGWASFGYCAISWCAQCAPLDSRRSSLCTILQVGSMQSQLHSTPCRIGWCPRLSQDWLLIAVQRFLKDVDIDIYCIYCIYIYMWAFHLLLFVHPAAGKHFLFLYVFFFWHIGFDWRFEALRFLSPPEYQLLNNMKLFTTSIVFRVAPHWIASTCLSVYAEENRKPSVWCWIFIPTLYASWSLDAF